MLWQFSYNTYSIHSKWLNLPINITICLNNVISASEILVGNLINFKICSDETISTI